MSESQQFIFVVFGLLGVTGLYHYLIYCVAKFFVTRRAKAAYIAAATRIGAARSKDLARAAEKQKAAEDSLRLVEEALSKIPEGDLKW